MQIMFKVTDSAAGSLVGPLLLNREQLETLFMKVEGFTTRFQHNLAPLADEVLNLKPGEQVVAGGHTVLALTAAEPSIW